MKHNNKTFIGALDYPRSDHALSWKMYSYLISERRHIQKSAGIAAKYTRCCHLSEYNYNEI